MQESFYLSFKTLPGEPYIPMDQSFSLGSEVGDYIIKSDDIARRHCLFEAKQNVVTITDLGSDQGTWVQDMRLEPGKTTILLPGDQIRLGESVVVDFIVAKELNPASHLHHWDEVETRHQQKDIFFDKEKEWAENQTENHFTDESHNESNKLNKSGEQSKKQSSSPAQENLEFDFDDKDFKQKLTIEKQDYDHRQHIAGPVRRFLSFILDTLVCFTILSIGETTLLESSLSKLSLNITSHSLVRLFCEYYIVFIAYKLLTTVLLKASLGQKIMGIYGTSYITSFIRAIIGSITGPLLLFDLPVLADRKSLKELVSTGVIKYKQGYSWLKPSLGFFLVILAFMLAPLFKGAIWPSSYEVITSHQAVEAGKSLNQVRAHRLNLFSLSLSDSAELALRIPYIDQENSEKGVHLFDPQRARQALMLSGIEISIFKLLKTIFHKDPVLSHFYPFLSKKINGRIFTKNWDDTEKTQYQSELFDLVKTSLSLDLTSYIDHISKRGPFIASYTYFKTKILEGMPAFDTVEAVQSPSATLYLFSKVGVAESQAVLPISFQDKLRTFTLKPGQGNNLDMLNILSRDHYFPYVNWNSKPKDTQAPFEPEDLVELISLLRSGQIQLTPNISRNLYEAFFNLAKKLFQGNHYLRMPIKKSYQEALQSYSKALKSIGGDNQLLIENLEELSQEWKQARKEFWGLES